MPARCRLASRGVVRDGLHSLEKQEQYSAPFFALGVIKNATFSVAPSRTQQLHVRRSPGTKTWAIRFLSSGCLCNPEKYLNSFEPHFPFLNYQSADRRMGGMPSTCSALPSASNMSSQLVMILWRFAPVHVRGQIFTNMKVLAVCINELLSPRLMEAAMKPSRVELGNASHTRMHFDRRHFERKRGVWR